jgi:plastocyanin
VAHRIKLAPPAAPRLARGVAALALSVAFLSACGNDSAGSDGAARGTSGSAETSSSGAATGSASAGSDSPEAGSIIATEADFTITLDEDTLTAGTYEITVMNEGNGTHDLVVERDGKDVAASEAIKSGASTTLSVDLEPGEYVFYCSIGDHRVMGMEVTVTVT